MGYAEIYKNWIFLQRGHRFFEGIQKIDLKDIADLYQIWCFLKMKGMIQSILGKDQKKWNWLMFRWITFFSLASGKASRVLFINSAGERIELYHDYTYGCKTKSENLSFTVEQRPDIVLRMSKVILKTNMLSHIYMMPSTD